MSKVLSSPKVYSYVPSSSCKSGMLYKSPLNHGLYPADPGSSAR